ncbi:MAG: SGNH/GDSL hydrolase family protein [Actinomycetota bacterium]|nr:SGNH/GDSL hydrolase family protein [Actinomycetota bacterium]
MRRSALLVASLALLPPLLLAPPASAAPLIPRASELPGESGIPTASTAPPTVTLSAANAGTSLASARTYTETATSVVRTLKAHLTRSLDSAAAYPDSITPISTRSFQVYQTELRTDAPKVEVRFRAVGGRYRIWVDGHPISLSPRKDPGGGAFYRAKLTFPSRALRNIRFESDATRFTGFTVTSSDKVALTPAPRKRAVIIGDSITEGARANARFLGYAHTLCQLAGWTDCWVAGSGGTGYLANGAPAYTNRVKFRSRIVNDAISRNPNVVLISGGRNDGAFTATQVQSESLALFKQIRSALPNAEIIVTSTYPATEREAYNTGLLARSNAIKTSAKGLANFYLDIMGSASYITGNGNAGAPTGGGNSDIYTSSDGVHPTQAGHNALARQLFKRYKAQLAP